jgi:uncharacterized protein (TIGR02147 family)
MTTRAKVDVFRFRDFRAFLRAYCDRAKAERQGFSYSALAAKVGLRSPNYPRLVIDGERNLTPELAHRFGEACGLSGDGLEFFCVLTAFNQAKSARERATQYEKLQGFRRFREAHRLDAAQSAYHSEWYIPAVFELCAHEQFDEDPHWIAATLLPPISPKQAKQALVTLEELGLIRRGESGKLEQAEAVVETPEGPLGHQVVQFHRVMMQRASEAIERVPREEREIASLTLCISEERLVQLKAELEAIQSRLAESYQSDPRPQRVVQVNIQMFPLSQKKE